MENSVEIPQKTRVASLSSNAVPGHISIKHENSNLKIYYIYTPMFIATVFNDSQGMKTT